MVVPKRIKQQKPGCKPLALALFGEQGLHRARLAHFNNPRLMGDQGSNVTGGGLNPFRDWDAETALAFERLCLWHGLLEPTP